MKRMKKGLLMIMSLAVLTGVLAGCGGQDAQGDGQNADNSGKKWIIATDTVFRPFEYKDENGNMVGIDVDILAAIAEDQGFDYELRSMGWDASIAACQSGQADAMIAGASITEERKNSGWTFSDAYYTGPQCMVVASMLTMMGEKSSLSTMIFCLSRISKFPFLSLPSIIQCIPFPVAAISISSFRFCCAISGG